MELLACLLLLLYIFVVHNNLIVQNVCNSNNIKELTDRRTSESLVDTSKCKFCRLLCSHLSAFAQVSKSFIMHNNRQGINATASLLAKTQIPQIAKDAARISTTYGFVSFYFDNLKHFLTKEECFRYINGAYYLLHGKLAYPSYQDFNNAIFGGYEK